MSQELPMVVVQVTRVEWSKASRGGEGARLRNSVPNRRLIAEGGFHPRQVIFEWEHWFEGDGWHEPSRHVASVSLLTELGKRSTDLVQMVWTGDGLEVNMNWGRLPGSPGRHKHPGYLGLHSDAESWVQLRWNERLVDIDTGQWSYRDSTYNIALLRQISRDIFVRTEPVREVIELARLR